MKQKKKKNSLRKKAGVKIKAEVFGSVCDSSKVCLLEVCGDCENVEGSDRG